MTNFENESTSFVLQSAKQGNKDALYEMAWRFELMPGNQNDQIEQCAWQDFWLEKAADARHVDARGRQARSLINRIMDQEYRNKAMKYFLSLSNDFDEGLLIGEEEKEEGALAKLWLGIMLCEGYHTPRDAQKGVEYIEVAQKYFDDFKDFGFVTLSKIGELYATGLTQPGGEPSIADLEKAIIYLDRAIHQFDPEKIDPQKFNPVNRLYKIQVERKESKKEVFKSLNEIAQDLGHSPVPENTTLSQELIDEDRRKMMELSPEAEQRLIAEKAAATRLREQLAREGW